MQGPVVDVAQQIPAGGNVSAPSSGSYGEGAALARLESALPGSDPSQQQAQSPLPAMTPRTPEAPPSGLPPGLLAPTRQPDVPVGTPLAQPNIIVGNGPEQRVALLEALIASPTVSEETKQFAQIMRAQYRKLGL